MLREKEDKVAAKQKKLDEVVVKHGGEGGDEEAVEKAEMELAEAQASLRVPLVEYVPEPVRVSGSLSYTRPSVSPRREKYAKSTH